MSGSSSANPEVSRIVVRVALGGPGQVAGGFAGLTRNGNLTNKGKFTFTANGDVKLK